jgi:hypothetical protein
VDRNARHMDSRRFPDSLAGFLGPECGTSVGAEGCHGGATEDHRHEKATSLLLFSSVPWSSASVLIWSVPAMTTAQARLRLRSLR